MIRNLLVLSLLINALGFAFIAIYIANKGGIRFLVYSIIESNRRPIVSYHERTRWSYFMKTPTKSDDVIMIGDSLIELGEWSELFQDLRFINRGISGLTVRSLVSKAEDLKTLSGAKTLILIGINDIWQGRNLDDIKENYSELIDFVSQTSQLGQLYIISLLPVFHPNLIERNQDILELNQFLERKCKSEKLEFINIHGLFTNEHGLLKKSLSYDGVHLNGEGYYLLKEALQPYMQQ